MRLFSFSNICCFSYTCTLFSLYIVSCHLSVCLSVYLSSFFFGKCYLTYVSLLKLKTSENACSGFVQIRNSTIYKRYKLLLLALCRSENSTIYKRYKLLLLGLCRSENSTIYKRYKLLLFSFNSLLLVCRAHSHPSLKRDLSPVQSPAVMSHVITT